MNLLFMLFYLVYLSHGSRFRSHNDFAINHIYLIIVLKNVTMKFHWENIFNVRNRIKLFHIRFISRESENDVNNKKKILISSHMI